jgi:cytoskeletal protein CcmA (bactofilin family)
MADSPTRRLTDRSSGPPTLIGAGVQFRGDIVAPGAVMLSGSVQGDGDVGGMLTIARDAHWEGQVRARSGVVAGRLTGSIVVSDRLPAPPPSSSGSVSAKSWVSPAARDHGDIP